MKNFIFGIVMVLFVIAACFGLGEMTVYLLFQKEVPCFPRFVTGVDYNGWKIRMNEPNAEYQHKSYDGKWQFKVNNQGYRSEKEYEYEKPADVFRVMTIGDSYTMGYEVAQEETYASVIEDALNQKGLKTEVINAGVSGYSNAEQLVYFEQEGLKFAPDVLILGFYLNDFNDNLRADLFKLGNGELVISKKKYQPAIEERDFLNSFGLYRWLSQHSYLHNFLNYRATAFFKKRTLLQKKAAENVAIDAGTGQASNDQKELAYAILKRIYEVAAANETHFIVLDITKPSLEGSSLGVDAHSMGLCGFYYNSLVDLQPLNDREDIHRPHGARHWSEVAHRVSGEKLAEYIFENHLIWNGESDVIDSLLVENPEAHVEHH